MRGVLCGLARALEVADGALEVVVLCADDPLVVAVLGAQLPDLLTRVPGLALDHAAARWTLPLHTPVGAALVCLLVAQGFTAAERPRALGLLLLGAASHLATDALQVVLTNDDLREQFEANTPMGRPGTVEDIAACALYLASPAGGWVTGKVFQVDGGTESPAISLPVQKL